MIHDFDEQAYLEVNLDVKEAVEKGEFPSVALYLKHFGLKRIEAGETKFHKELAPFSETVYLEDFPEVVAMVESGEYSSAFDHFCQIGYTTLIAYLQHKNTILNPPKNEPTKEERLIKGFDEEAYLEVNRDVKEAVERGDFPSVEVYLEQFGLRRIEAGKCKFHNDFEPYNKASYLEEFPEVKTLVKSGEFNSVFDHFCEVGYGKILIENDLGLIKGFDEKAYLYANSDVEEALVKGVFPSTEVYLRQFGLARIKNETCRFHKDFEPFNHIEYLKLIPELQAMIQEKKYLDEFEHFTKIGYKQIINGKIDWNLTGTPYAIPDIKKASKLVGGITEYDNGQIRGWCYSSEQFEPLLLVNGRPCKIVKSNIPLSRVAQDNKLDRDDIGFVAEVAERFMDATDISLYATSSNSCVKVVSTNKFIVNNVSPRSLSVFNDLKEISSQKNAVAIVVWDVTHNPIGRAKVLYDIVKEKHPVIMIGFDFGFSKSEVWEPIAFSDIKLLSIKWDEKELYSRTMQDMGISFDTVWICKPRLPSFVLADMFSHEKTNFILDIDDNESEMSQSNAFLPKPYGLLGNHLAESIVEKIAARSVASVSIKDRWGGEFVRHARIAINPEMIKERRELPEKIKIGFLGTVRPHKNIDKAAEMIKKIQLDQGIDLEFNVGGHFYPNEIRKTIESFGAKTYGVIPHTELFKCLDDMDVLVTGFPLDGNENEITKYQISSKIGDALSAGRPVLVPEGSSVKDLVNIPGIYLFNENNFSEKLLAAIHYHEIITLPSLFTLSDNYEMFKKLQKLASQKIKSDIFTVPLLTSFFKENAKPYRPTLVLLWKQPDSTLYGRRVDQLARSYKRKYPSHRVVLIEMINRGQEMKYKSQADLYTSDSPLILERLREKRITLELEGVEHIVLEDQIFKEEDYFRSFLLSQKMLPQNTLFVLFPVIGYFEKFFNIIDGYRYIADIVDNQLGWKSKYPEKIVQQYKILSKNSEYVIFNSDNNRKFFIDHGFLEEEQNLVITNWYELPRIVNKNVETTDIIKNKQIVYSGNMDDRIDWDLIDRLLDVLPEDITLYLIGSAQSSAEKISYIVSKHKNCQYLGSIDERILIEFLKNSIFTIMPHSVESTSSYMNPLKVHMYAAVGIECVSTNVPGLEKRFKNLTITNDSETFIKTCIDKINAFKSKVENSHHPVDLDFSYKESRDVYIELIKSRLDSLTII